MVSSSLTQAAATAERSPRSYQLLLRALDRSQAVLWITGFAFVMSLPAMATGLVTDDYVIEAAVQRDLWSAFEFTPRDANVRIANTLANRAAGRAPWWIDEHAHQAFLRPLASLTHAIDFRLWPNAVWWMHVENSVVFALVALLAGLVYTELGLPRPVLALATFFYAINGNHAMSVAWLSGRNTLLGAAFGLFAFWLHLRGETRVGLRKVVLQLAAAGALGCGLLASEFAAGIAGFLLADALVLRDGGIRRVICLWPYAVVLGAWQVVYITGHYGAIGSGFHHGPAEAPGLFVLGVVTGVPIYLATQLALPIATVACLVPNGLLIISVISLVVLFLLRGLLGPLWRSDRRVRFFLLGSALSAVPLGATAAQERLAFFVSLGTAAVVAILVMQRFAPTNVDLPRAGAARLFRIHGLYLPIVFVPMLFSTANVLAAGGGTTALADALPKSDAHGVVILNAPLALQIWYQTPIRQRRGLAALPFIDVLYAGGRSIEVSRPSERSLEVEVAGGYLATAMEQSIRDPGEYPFHTGDVVRLSRLTATVLAVNGARAPTHVRFEWNAPLERLDFEWMVWQGRAPRAWSLPPVGSRVMLPALPAFP